MSDWYASSAAYAGYTAFQTSHAYSVGDLITPVTPALKAKWVLRCTTAGTSAGSEPTWPTANNGTVTTGGAVFTNVTGQSTYGWSAAAGDLATLLTTSPRFAGGDRIFVSSDHSETQTTNTVYGSGNSSSGSYSLGQVLSVNRAGSVPPVAADLTAGAAVASSGVLSFELAFLTYHYGINFTCTGVVGFVFNNTSAGFKTVAFELCQLYLSGGNSSARFLTGGAVSVVLNNSTVKLSQANQAFVGTNAGCLDLTWLNTSGGLASGSTVPTQLFSSASNLYFMTITMRGVDLSTLTSTLLTNANAGAKVLLDSCKIASGLTRLSLSSAANTRDEVELVNCYNGTNIINERYVVAGAVTTETTIVLTDGATDNVGTFSHKMVSNANVDKIVNPLTSFWLDTNYTTTGSSKTATVEIISSTALNNDEISLELEYLGTAGSSLASLANNLPTTVLTSAAAVTTSTATWTSSPGTPQKQKLQVTFTPQTAGRVRGRVRLGKASATVYVNPQITIT